MSVENESKKLLSFIVDRVNVGIFILDEKMNIQLWNRFMSTNSGFKSEEVSGKNLFELFPALPQRWFKKKVDSVFILKNFSFISWEQRPYLFEFPHSRPVTGGVEFMHQDITIMPIREDDGTVKTVCVMVTDTTDVAIYQGMLKEALIKLEHANKIDGLTNIYNRAHWEQRLREEFSRAHRYERELSLIMFDLDHFKLINDNYGHLAGDEVLKNVSRILKNQVREIDIPGRYGGEEFGIVLPDTDIAGAKIVAERLRKEVFNTVINYDKSEIKMSVSLGISQFDKTLCENCEQLISQADTALYQSKESGRNRWSVFNL